MSDLKETKVALVTGGSRGIGRGIALILADAGYDIAITYTNKKELAEDVAAQIRNKDQLCSAGLYSSWCF